MATFKFSHWRKEYLSYDPKIQTGHRFKYVIDQYEIYESPATGLTTIKRNGFFTNAINRKTDRLGNFISDE